MNTFDATELAYKNGYEDGIRAAEKAVKGLLSVPKCDYFSRYDGYCVNGLDEVHCAEMCPYSGNWRECECGRAEHD